MSEGLPYDSTISIAVSGDLSMCCGMSEVNSRTIWKTRAISSSAARFTHHIFAVLGTVSLTVFSTQARFALHRLSSQTSICLAVQRRSLKFIMPSPLMLPMHKRRKKCRTNLSSWTWIQDPSSFVLAPFTTSPCFRLKKCLALDKIGLVLLFILEKPAVANIDGASLEY